MYDLIRNPYRMAELDDLCYSDLYSNPETLTDLCLELISNNLDIISIKDINGNRTLREGLAFPAEICDKLIKYIQYLNIKENINCLLSIFNDTAATRLRHVKITSCQMRDAAVKTLMSHKPIDLEIMTWCLSKLAIEHINANSENLRSLIFRGKPMFRLVEHEYEDHQKTSAIDHYKRGYVFKIPNLRRLTLAFVGFIGSILEIDIILAGLTNLTHLDLFTCYVAYYDFYNHVPNLISLTLVDVEINRDAKAFVNGICQLKKLRHLDISQHNYEYGQFKLPNKILGSIILGLPELESLDIGGTNLAGRGVAERPLDTILKDFTNNALCDIPGLASRIHKPLQFLGLYGTAHGACKRHDIPAKVIAGDANEDQIFVAAHVCMHNKPKLLQKVLSDIYRIFRYENCQRMDQALSIVLKAMEKHPFERHIQVSGSATLFYIVKMKEKGKLTARTRRRIISTLLTGMKFHKEEETMMRNGCLALCQFRIPQDVMFNYEALVEVLLHSANHVEPEGFVQRIGIYLLNSLACQVEGKEKCLLGKLGCVQTMLNLIGSRVQAGICDDVLEIAWSTMWNMTDETAINCQRFLDERGMEKFLTCINQYPGKEELLRNMMGLLGNVAEVDYLRVRLMKHRYVCVFANLLRSKSDGIEVSYNAAGILAHMASDGVEAWTLRIPRRKEILNFMVEAIETWDLFAERNINYRSFLPLLRLLDVYHTPECQHWAVWALTNLTNVYPHKYCSLVIKEGGIEKLNALKADPRPYDRIKQLAEFVIENCQNNRHPNDANCLQTHSDSECSLDG